MGITVYGDRPAEAFLPYETERTGKPPRKLLVKFLSKTKMRDWTRRFALAKAHVGTDAERDALYDVLLAEVVVGWENIDAPFTIAGISDQFALLEFFEIIDCIPVAMVPGVEDLKKSASPSSSPGA